MQLFWLPLHPSGPIAAAAKSPQSCPTLCDPTDGSPPGCPVPGILQARTLEWVAISLSNAWNWKVKVKSPTWVPSWGLSAGRGRRRGEARVTAPHHWGPVWAPEPRLPGAAIHPESSLAASTVSVAAHVRGTLRLCLAGRTARLLPVPRTLLTVLWYQAALDQPAWPWGWGCPWGSGGRHVSQSGQSLLPAPSAVIWLECRQEMGLWLRRPLRSLTRPGLRRGRDRLLTWSCRGVVMTGFGPGSAGVTGGRQEMKRRETDRTDEPAARAPLGRWPGLAPDSTTSRSVSSSSRLLPLMGGH